MISDKNNQKRVKKCKALLKRFTTRTLSIVVFLNEKRFTVEEMHNPQNV
jgi:hypothetical protein